MFLVEFVVNGQSCACANRLHFQFRSPTQLPFDSPSCGNGGHEQAGHGRHPLHRPRGHRPTGLLRRFRSVVELPCGRAAAARRPGSQPLRDSTGPSERLHG